MRKLLRDEYKNKIPEAAPVHAVVMREPDEIDLISRELNVATISTEYGNFINGDPINIASSALDWWLQQSQQQTYPALSRMAIDIFSIPATSAEPERIFSGARRTVSWERSRLGEHRIEVGECSKSWLRQQIGSNIPQARVNEILRNLNLNQSASEATEA